MTQVKKIHSSIHDYEIYFESDFSFIRDLLDTKGAVFIIDQNILQLYEVEFKSLLKSDNLIILNAVEENKTLQASESIFDKIVTLNPTKKTKIISFGGGITQDVSGFVASTFYRGLNWIYVPTTLLAQADSCMGSKTSLNYKSYKNILGTFYPPHQIFICPRFTNTLAEEDFYSGMGEVVKLHTMGGVLHLDKLIFDLNRVNRRELTTILKLTKSSLDIKWTYMEGDEFDQGKRNLLNYGHEFGHAIETATQYKIPHGQAIIIGMIMANFISFIKGVMGEDTMKKTERIFKALLKSDVSILKIISNDQIINPMKQDKKRIGDNLPLIMMNNDYAFSKILDLTESEAISAIDYFRNHYCI
jgi:3-dehydroquinate synthase